MYQYDQETTLTPTGDQQYAGHVHASWNIGDNPNGGYLASLAVSAFLSRAIRSLRRSM